MHLPKLLPVNEVEVTRELSSQHQDAAAVLIRLEVRA